MRRALALVAVLLLAACSGADVHTESAAVPGAPTTPAPIPSSPPAPAPTAPTVPDPTADATPTGPPATEPSAQPATTAPADPDEPSVSVGDRLFPELGSADLDVVAYDVALAYDIDAERIDAAVTIELLVDRPLDVIALDATDVDVDAVTVDGVAATFDRTKAELLVDLPVTAQPATPVSVAVTYHDDRHETADPFGLGAGWFPTAAGSFVLNEPDGARSWLPSNDTPADKATWQFEITVPDDVAGIANGRLVGQVDNGDGTSTWSWEEPAPMATYMVQLLVGDYEVLPGGTAGAAGVALTNVALHDDVERMQPYFDRTAEQLTFFEDLFGPYPFDHYGLAFADSTPGIAMEMLGRSMFSRDDFRGQRDEVTEMFLSHELAHQWFGDSVTPARWEDLWLNESFATYAQWLWLDHAGYGDLEATAETVLQFRQDRGDPTGDPATSGGLFSFERYDGGAVVLHALRREIGDDAFFTVLRRWAGENAGTSRTSADFEALAEDVAGRDLGVLWSDWLDAESLPSRFPD